MDINYYKWSDPIKSQKKKQVKIKKNNNDNICNKMHRNPEIDDP